MDDIIDDSGKHFVHFKGCNIGKVTKFLKAFKDALDADGITAPMFFHGLFWDAAAGIFEYLAYEFRIHHKTAFTTQAAVIKAFADGGFSFIDGTPVLPARWKEWVPTNFGTGRPTTLKLDLGQTAGGRSKLKVDRDYRVESNRKHPFTWPMDDLSPFPAKEDYLKTLTDDITGAEQFQNTYGFPFFERWGYANALDFINGLTWTFRRGKKQKANSLIATGTRAEYTLRVPLTDPTDDHLRTYPSRQPSQLLRT